MIDRNQIFIGEKIKDKDSAIDFIAEEAKKLGLAKDKDILVEAIKEREKEFSTDLGMGISIPHAKNDVVIKPSVMFIRYDEEIGWAEDSKVKASIVFLTPKEAEGNTHLTMLSRVSRKLMHEEFLEKLLKSTDKEEIFKSLDDALQDK